MEKNKNEEDKSFLLKTAECDWYFYEDGYPTLEEELNTNYDSSSGKIFFYFQNLSKK